MYLRFYEYIGLHTFVHPLNIGKTIMQKKMTAMALENGARSNGWDRVKVIIGIISWHIVVHAVSS